MKKILSFLCTCFMLMMLVSCGDKNIHAEDGETTSSLTGTESETTSPALDKEMGNAEMTKKMQMQIGEYTFTAILEDNEAVKELVEMMKENPVVLKLDDYSGFEKVGSLGKSLTRSDKQTTAESGDIVLYNGNNIVVFYGSNSWSYTRIGKVDNLTDWKKALGKGSVTVTFRLAE